MFYSLFFDLTRDRRSAIGADTVLAGRVDLFDESIFVDEPQRKDLMIRILNPDYRDSSFFRWSILFIFLC